MMAERTACLWARTASDPVFDVTVIGAGQAGLAAGACLQQAGLEFIILDSARRIGDSWRQRFDSLKLFSPRALSSLPGLPLKGIQDGYPTKDEIADYLQSYACHHRLSVNLEMRVEALRRESGLFATEANGYRILSRGVIVATGAFQIPAKPWFAEELSPDVLQLDCGSYRGPNSIPEGRVLVVGGGATGRQIARELCATRETWLACGKPVAISPHRIFGKDAIWWAKASGFLNADKASWKGRIARRVDSFPGSGLDDKSLRRAGVQLVGRAIGARGNCVAFEKGTEQNFGTVIWAVGYRDDTTWLKVNGAVVDDTILEDRGISPVPGLYYVGRSWQKSRASALLCGVGAEANEIVAHLCDFLSFSSRAVDSAVSYAKRANAAEDRFRTSG